MVLCERFEAAFEERPLSDNSLFVIKANAMQKWRKNENPIKQMSE